MSTHNGKASLVSDAQPSKVRGERAVRKGAQALAACEHCRRRKTKCDCQRPACQRCVRLRLSCKYETQAGETRAQATKRNLRVSTQNSLLYEELFEYLRTLDSYRANDIYQRIRYGFDLQNLLTQIRAGDLTSQLNLQPETQYRYELPYIKRMPPELLANNGYLNTLIYETASLGLEDREPRLPESTMSLPRVVYLRPFHAARFVDRLIEDAKPSLWTAVCQDDGIMRRLLRNHFLCEFYFMSALQKDLFLEDMISDQGEFCSSLLVNAVLAYACVCDPDIPNRAEYWNPASLTYKFLMEAKRLWEMEGTTPRISTIQAGFILNGISNLSGLDEIGHTYRKQSIALANRMGLYNGPISATNERSRQGKIYTAWALFCWDALLAFSLQQPPLLPRPPHDPLPSSTDNSEWYGQFWLQYPGHKDLIDANFGVFFEHRARFRVIMAQYCSTAYGAYRAPASLTQDAYICRAQLLHWFSELPTVLQPENVVLPAQLQLHMYYHHFVVTIFEPLLDVRTHRLPQPEAITHEANRYFATLFRLYYIRHGNQNMDIHVIISMIFAGTRCLEKMQQQPPGSDMESLRSTLILCAIGLYNQRRNNYLAHALYSALRSKMRPEEVMLLKQVPDLHDDDEALSLQRATRSRWIPTVMNSKDDSDDDGDEVLPS